MNIIGLNLRNLRRRAGLTQQQFVDALAEHGVFFQVCTLCKIELGNRKVFDTEIFAFARILNVPIAQLFEAQPCTCSGN